MCAILDNIDEELSCRIEDFEIELDDKKKGPVSPERWAWTLDQVRHVRLGEEILEFVRLIRDEVEDKYAIGVAIEVGEGAGDEEEEELEDAMSVLTIGWDRMRAPIR